MSRPTRAELLGDLVAEEAELAALLAPLSAAQWDRATPAAGWQVRDQVAHLAMGEDLATLAATDERGFADRLAELMNDLERVDADQQAEARARRSRPSSSPGGRALPRRRSAP